MAEKHQQVMLVLVGLLMLYSAGLRSFQWV